MAEEELKMTRLKVGNTIFDLAKKGKRFVGGVIYKGDDKGDINFEIIREFPIKIKYERYVRCIPKERFLDFYKIIANEIKKGKLVGKRKAKAKGTATMRKAKAKSKAKKRGTAKKRCGSKKK